MERKKDNSCFGVWKPKFALAGPAQATIALDTPVALNYHLPKAALYLTEQMTLA